MVLPRVSTAFAFLLNSLFSLTLVLPSSMADLSEASLAPEEFQQKGTRSKEKFNKNNLFTHDRAALRHFEAKKAEAFKKDGPLRSLKNKTPKAKNVSLEACYESSAEWYFSDSILQHLDYYIFADFNSPTFLADLVAEGCDGVGTNEIHCDFSAYASYNPRNNNCRFDPENNHYVLMRRTQYFFEYDVTWNIDELVCIPKDCDIDEAVRFYRLPITTDIKSVENGPKKKEGRLNDCTEDIEAAVARIRNLASGVFYDFLEDSIILEFGERCNYRGWNQSTLYCDVSAGDSSSYDELRNLCLNDEGKQWVTTKIITTDPYKGVVVIIDNDGRCSPKTCDTKAFAKSLNKAVTFKFKQYSDFVPPPTPPGPPFQPIE